MAVFIDRKFLESISWAISISRWYLSRVNLHYGNTCLLNCISGDLNLGVVLELLDFCMILVFEGKALGQEIWQYAVNGHIVLKLTKPLPKNAGFKIFADNYFTSVPLVAKLLNDGFFMLEQLEFRTWEVANLSVKRFSKSSMQIFYSQLPLTGADLRNKVFYLIYHLCLSNHRLVSYNKNHRINHNKVFPHSN